MNHNRGSRENKSARKRKGIFAALLALILGLGVAAPAVRAEEKQAAEPKQASAQPPEQLISWEGLSSRGSLVYRQEEEGAQIYAADFLLLRDRLGIIPDTVFEPACYAHNHQWEYLDTNGETHTRHCSICGHAFDLVSIHKAERRETCSLFHEGTTYPGIRYTCVCGYQWECEKAHTLFFESVDEAGHRSGCRLNGTGFCPGYEPVTEEHYAYCYNSCGDGRHHEKICLDCGYQSEEACSFTLLDSDGEENDSGESGEDDSGGNDGVRRCWCGNVETGEGNAGIGTGEDHPAGETASDPSGTESGDESEGTQTGENPSGTEPGEETADEEPGMASEMPDEEPGMASEMPDEEPGMEPETPDAEPEDETEENTDSEQGGGYEE